LRLDIADTDGAGCCGQVREEVLIVALEPNTSQKFFRMPKKTVKIPYFLTNMAVKDGKEGAERMVNIDTLRCRNRSICPPGRRDSEAHPMDPFPPERKITHRE
jgi:hypothetical protein